MSESAIDARARRMVLDEALPACPERDVHGVRAWLPPDLKPPDVDEMNASVWQADEVGDTMLVECVAQVRAAMAAIERGESPAPYALPLDLENVEIRLYDRLCWLVGDLVEADGSARTRLLQVYALDPAAGWALTLHGLCFYRDSAGERLDEPDIDAEDEPRRSGMP